MITAMELNSDICKLDQEQIPKSLSTMLNVLKIYFEQQLPPKEVEEDDDDNKAILCIVYRILKNPITQIEGFFFVRLD